MAALYILILAGSTLLAVTGLLRLEQRFVKLLGWRDAAAGPWLMFPLLGFLLVVHLPPGAWLALLALLLLGLREERGALAVEWRAGALFFAVMLGLSALYWPKVPLPVMLPQPVLFLGAYLLWLGIASTGPLFPVSLGHTALLFFAASAPLTVTPLLFPASASSLALDIALTGSALLGALWRSAPSRPAGPSLHWPLAFLFGYLVLRAIIGGAWPLALAALAIGSGGIAFLRMTDGSHGRAS